MNITWDKPKTVVSGHKPAHSVEPYEDWEQATRSPELAKDAQIWKPIYVDLNKGEQGDFTSAIKALVKFMLKTDRGNSIQHDADFLPVVVNIIVGELVGENVERFTRFFLYRPEAKAYDAIPECETLHIGVGFPLSKSIAATKLDTLDRVFRAAKTYARNSMTGTMPPEVLHHFVFDRPLGDKIMLGVIDKHEAVRNHLSNCQGDDHPAHLSFGFARSWPQSKVASRNGSELEFGRSLNGADVSADYNDVVYDGTVDEIQLYCGLRADSRRTYQSDSRLNVVTDMHGVQVNANNAIQLEAFTDNRLSEPTGRADSTMFVQLPQLTKAETWGGRLEFFILTGLIRIFSWADNFKCEAGELTRSPIVVQINHEILDGSQNSTGFLKSEIERLARQRSAEGVATAVVFTNSSKSRTNGHALKKLPRGDDDHIDWRIAPEDQSTSFVELWLDQLNRATLTLNGPDGIAVEMKLSRNEFTDDNDEVILPSYTVDATRQITGRGDFLVARAYVRRFASTSRTRVVLAFAPGLNKKNRGQSVQSGNYSLRLKNTVGATLYALIKVKRDDAPLAFPLDVKGSGQNTPKDQRTEVTPDVRAKPLWTVGSVTRLGTLSVHSGGNSTDVHVSDCRYVLNTNSTSFSNASSQSLEEKYTADVSAVTEVDSAKDAQSGVYALPLKAGGGHKPR
ncbi:hypothetical protein J7426_13065 [Tropicibacter sp. R16_0]|uniref:hypothetical protein n=1 Tax=Tropicibacter sp. R16_0 TaxID=2821102 RepID=UPI001ADB1556|nr:hypothetical protein [Tropicibacter sp. R16_0]MBO9451194.1 hypothetical protein [Tropicibacter sp. R16_0]